MTLYCDNERAVHLSNEDTFLSQNFAHVDLITRIRHLCKTSPFKVVFRHVRGHQDELYHTDCLARPSQIVNIFCDHLAKAYLLSLLVEDTVPTFCQESLLGEGPRCFLADQKLVGDFSHCITDFCSKQLTREYLSSKGVLPSTLFDDVNWTALGHHLRLQTIPYRVWAAKHRIIIGFVGNFYRHDVLQL